MALIEKYIVVADHYPVKPGVEIIEGMMLTLDSSSGELKPAVGAGGEFVVGISADTKSTSTSGLPSVNNALIGADATSQQFVNRLTDQFDETKASGRCTVYHSGGTFLTDQYRTGDVFTLNAPLYVSAVTAGKLSVTAGSGTAPIVGYCTKVPSAYPSGVPGTDVEGSLTLGNYLEFKMVV